MSLIEIARENSKKVYNLEYLTKNMSEVYQIFKEIKQKYGKRVKYEKISFNIRIEYFDDIDE